MDSVLGGVVPLLTLLLLLLPVSSVQNQDLRDSDAVCGASGCFVVFFQRKTFLDSWRSCKEKGGNLATVKHREAAAAIQSLFSTLDLRHARTRVQVWIGLQRQPRQCAPSHPLRGFSWTTGDQDTDYVSWQEAFSASTCSVPRCVTMGYDAEDQTENFRWRDGPCSVPVDGYLCHYAYRGMCPPLQREGAGPPLYTTPFDLVSTLLTHVPFGSVASVPCGAGVNQDQSVGCLLKDDGSVGWSRAPPLCAAHPAHAWCEQDNGGCEHFCRSAVDHFYCECDVGYELADDGQSCDPFDACQDSTCEFECLPLADGFRCACPEGHMLAPDERGCLDVDECLQSPCEQRCVNAPGTFACLCHDGFQPDQQGACEDVDECVDEPCEHACENTQGSFICHCHLGLSPLPEDPTRCQDTDECQIEGTCEQMCVNYEGGFECYCKEGYELLEDHFSCQRVNHPDLGPPGPQWGPVDYDWNQQQIPTDPPRDLDSDVIWVTRAPQEELIYDAAQDPGTPETEDETDTGHGALGGWTTDTTAPPTLYWYDEGEETARPTPNTHLHMEQEETSSAPTTHLYAEGEETTSSAPTTHLYAEGEETSSAPTTHWFGKEEEETTSTTPFPSNPTLSGGPWNWWSGLTPKVHMDVYDDDREGGEESQLEDEDVPTLPSPAQTSTPEDRDVLDPVQEDRGPDQSSSWLLVAVLVPISLFLLLIAALALVFRHRCATATRDKNASDCYHWISGGPGP